MIEIRPIKKENLHVGTFGYVYFEHSTQTAMIICKVLKIQRETIEVIAVASDGTCIFINPQNIFERIGLGERKCH